MATVKEIIRYNLWRTKSRIIYKYGFSKGLITSYDTEFIENLRNVYYGCYPISLLILDVNGCKGKCYEKALLATFGFKDEEFKKINADVEYITYSLANIDKIRKQLGYLPPHYGNHSFIEVTSKKDGMVWVYDTTAGLRYEKNLYYMLNNPKITSKKSKEEIINYIEYQDIIESNKTNQINKDKYILPTLLPMLEKRISESDNLYEKYLLKEIELLKKEIDYDNLCKEVEEGRMQFEESILSMKKIKK